MNGLELTHHYFQTIAEPTMKNDYPALYSVMAAGLVGNGSECFGYDDDISRDHDWGIDFFIWLPDAYRDSISVIQNWKDALFHSQPPLHLRERSTYGAHLGVMTVGDFYKSLIGFPEGPNSIIDWRRIPEENLAMATNGCVFVDNSCDFTAVRNYLLKYYPEDLRLKKLAARCMAIAQTGQYNVSRCYKRGDYVTLRHVLTRFADNVISTVFLLNRVFKPYYKWAFRKMTELPILGAEIKPLLESISISTIEDGKAINSISDLIDIICNHIIEAMKVQELTTSNDWFLTTHAEEIQQRILDSFLRSLPTQYE